MPPGWTEEGAEILGLALGAEDTTTDADLTAEGVGLVDVLRRAGYAWDGAPARVRRNRRDVGALID